MKVQESKYVFKHCDLTEYFHSEEAQSWGNLAAKVCPQLIESFPIEQHKSYHRMLMGINVQYNCPKTNIFKSWTLLKEKDDFDQFNKKLKREGIQHVVSSPLKKKLSFFSELKKDSSLEENEKFIHYLQKVSVNPKMFSHVIFQQFVNNCLPHSKKHLNVKGQIIVTEQAQKGFSILPTCFFGEQEQPTHKYCLTLTSQMIMISEKHFYMDEAIEVIPFSRYFKLNYHYRKGQYVLVIKSLRQRFEAKFCDFNKLMKAAIMISIAYKDSNYWRANKYQSFAPQRTLCATKMFIDGEEYFNQLYETILLAKKKICITDWWLSPSFSLKKPDLQGQYRFDNILKSAAQKDVKIFIILFRESNYYSNINSENVEEHLEQLHQNITVIRHPNPLIPTLWSHHQKLVIVDEEVAFLGGFDICEGRWDTKKHSICSYQSEQSGPWHDTAIKIAGPVVVDVQRHFAQYWYFVIKDLLEKPSAILKRLNTKISEIATQDIYFQMLSNQNFNEKDSDVEDNEIDQIVEDESSVSDEGKYSVSTKDSKNSQLEKNYYLSEFQKKADTLKNLVKQGHKNIQIFTNEKMQTKFFEVLVEGNSKKQQNGNMKVQVLRSASSWSIGLRNKRIECSIYNAYKEAIKNAKKYIYIENQSFISTQNKILEVLAQRIQKAHERSQDFKVIVVIPLTPKLPTDANDKDSITFKKQMKLQYQTIKNNENSFFNRLSHIENLKDYIHFFGLRTHSMSTSGPITKQIYVNSKLLIADDQTMIIGSANVSDRSMLGSRDSEVAVIIQSDEQSHQILNLREKLFVEHFGLTVEQAKDFVGSWSSILKASRNNTLIYREVFGCVPDNTVFSFSQAESLKSKANIKKYVEKKTQIKGFAVDFPLDFLKNEQIYTIGTQHYIPFETFT